MQSENPMYSCLICGNLVALLENGGGTLSCCEQPMEPLPLRQAEDAEIEFTETVCSAEFPEGCIENDE